MDWIKKTIKWCWDHLQNIWLIVGAVMSFGLPAWALKASDLFATYAPLSWVLAGFAGLLVGTVIYALYQLARVWRNPEINGLGLLTALIRLTTHLENKGLELTT